MIQRVALLGIAVALLVGPAAQAQSDSPTPTPTKAKHHAKIDGAIMQLIEAQRTGSSTAYRMARALGVPFDGNRVTVTVELDLGAVFGSAAPFVAQAIGQAFESNVVAAQSKSFIRLRVPLNLLALLEQIVQMVPEILYIRPPLAPQALTVSEGVALIGADALHSSGVLGQGVKVAVIDLGFAGLSRARARGELPNIQTRDFTGTGLESGTSHGTAVAEILHDVAPNAQLLLMKIGDEVDLENAVDEAIRQGVRVINHSVGWFNTNFYDGTGVIAQIARRARSAGVLWVNSAGNYARRHYKGFFRDVNRNGWMEFSGGDESLDLRAKAGEVIQIYLTWRDWPATAQDYDLYLFDSRGNAVAVSDKTQAGTEEPTEGLRYSVPSSGTYRVQVRAYSAPSPKEIALFSLFHDLEHAVPQSSIVAPANSADVLTVAAINRGDWTTGPQAPYSSQGPTGDGRPKPDIAGPDDVSTYTLGAFKGTSAAAPHVAGAAALLLSQNPGLSGDQIASRLRATAVNMGSSLALGSGRLRLSAPAVRRPDLVIARVEFTPRQPDIGDLLNYVITVRNRGDGDATSFVVRLQDRNGSEQRQVSHLAAASSTTVSFSRRLDVARDTVTITADARDQVAESNEANNTVQIQVTARQPTSKPDLIVEAMDYTPETPQVGGALQFLITVRNRGSAAAGPFRVELRSAAGTLTQGLGGLGAGSAARLTFNTSLHADGETFTAKADALNQVQESDEANNVRQVRVRATPPPPPPPPPGPALSGRIWVDQAHYAIGSSLRLHFELSARAYVYVLDVDAAGRVSQVFPNSFSTDNLLDAGTYTLPDGPYTFTVTGPQGTESLHLVLSLRPVRLGLDGLQRPSYTDPETFAAEIAQRLRTQVPESEWTTAFTRFQVGTVTPPPPPPPPSNQPPQARFSYTPQNPVVGQTTTFDGTASSDPDGRITQHRWDFNGDGRVDATGARVGVRFTSAGSYRVTLTVVDDRGASDSVSQTLRVEPSGGGELSIEVRTDKSQYEVGESVTIRYSVNKACTAKLTIIKPDGTRVVFGPNGIPAGTRSVTAPAGYPTGRRQVIFEAWAGSEYKKVVITFDVVD